LRKKTLALANARVFWFNKGMEISEDMMRDIANELNKGATWAELGNAYGINSRTLKAAYLRCSRKVYEK
jgi:hypothetical protein